jgi:hypothetical protein
MKRFDRRQVGKLVAGLSLGALAGGFATGVGATPPPGWIAAGDHPTDYDMGVDKTVLHDAKPSAYIKSIVDETKGFGTLMQTISAEQYRGKRLRVSGYVKSEDVNRWTGLWMRVDGSQRGQVLAFDNMQSRAITATTDWKRYEVVLDVAPEAQRIAFGVLLVGKGRVFVNGLGLEPVDGTVQTTGAPLPKPPSVPKNLDFDR